MKTINKLIPLAMIAALTIAVADGAMAETKPGKEHPRREQVNDRLANQNMRVKHEVAEGDLTRQQAAQLHKLNALRG